MCACSRSDDELGPIAPSQGFRSCKSISGPSVGQPARDKRGQGIDRDLVRQLPSPRVRRSATIDRDGMAVRIVRAGQSRIFGEPPGLYPDDVVAAARYYLRIDHDEVVEGTNHYSIVLDARGAAAVAAHCCRREPLQRPAGWVVAGGTAPRFPTQTRGARRGLLRRVPANAEAEQVPQAHDPNQRGPRNDGKMAKPAAEHDLGRSLRVDMGPDGLRVACHPRGYW